MKNFFFSLLLISLIPAIVFSQENKISYSFDTTYLGAYLDKGFDVFGPGSHSGTKSSFNIHAPRSGVGLNITNFRANTGGFENKQKFNYAIYYQNKLFQNKKYATAYKINYCFHHFPDQPRNAANSQEIILNLAWPKLLHTNFTPLYSFCYEYPAGNSYQNRTISGWVHIFGLAYEVPVKNFIPEFKKQMLNLSTLIFYNDGFGGNNIDHDFSHMLLGASTKFQISKNLDLTPGFYYQSSWDDSVNTEDEYWTSLKLSYKF